MEFCERMSGAVIMSEEPARNVRTGLAGMLVMVPFTGNMRLRGLACIASALILGICGYRAFPGFTAALASVLERYLAISLNTDKGIEVRVKGGRTGTCVCVCACATASVCIVYENVASTAMYKGRVGSGVGGRLRRDRPPHIRN